MNVWELGSPLPSHHLRHCRAPWSSENCWLFSSFTLQMDKLRLEEINSLFKATLLSRSKDKSKNLSPDHPLLPSTQPLPASFPFSLVLWLKTAHHARTLPFVLTGLFCTQLIQKTDHGIWSHHFMGNRWGNSGNSVRLFIFGLQNHCRWWLQPWN